MSDSRFKGFFKNLGSYAKNHPWKTAAFAAVAIGGLLLVAGGIVLIATSPASFGGGAAVGVPLFAVGGALAAGAVVIVGGLAVTGTATGLFMQSAKKEGFRKEYTQKMAHVDLLLSESHGIEMPVIKKPVSAKKSRSFSIKSLRRNQDVIVRSHSADDPSLFKQDNDKKKNAEDLPTPSQVKKL